jgi:EmrB/QacA subfamily drug resistance transporter
LAALSRRGVLAATILGSALAFIDGTVVNVALPALQRSLGAGVADLQWVVEAYALPFSALLLAGGAMGDRFGRRRVYAVGIALFTAASVLCGLAGSVRALVLARALQGVGAALLVPGSLALIAAAFPEDQRGRAIGAWSSFSAATTAVGPVLGGWLIDRFDWRWAFFLNVPIAAAALVLLFRCVPESRDADAPRRLDWPGAALATAGLGGLVYGLIEAAPRGWRDAGVLAAIAAGVMCLVAFVVVEARRRAPMLPPSLFRSRTFLGANLLTFALYGGMTLVMFVLPMDLVQVHGYSATAAGAATLPIVIILFLLSRWSGGLIERMGARRPLVLGPLLVAVGLALLARTGATGSYWGTFLPPMVVLGLGMALTVAPLTTTVMNAVEVAHAGLASGVNNAVSRSAGLLALAVISVPLLHVFDRELERRLAAADLPASVVAEVRSQRMMLAGVTPPAGAAASERRAVEHATAAAFVAAFRFVAGAAAVLALAGSAAAALTIRGSKAGAGRST